MTIHKAKGLEFDTVIIPGIETSKRQSRSRLLAWLEAPYKNDIDLLLAPIKASENEDDSIQRYIQKTNQKKDLQEFRRLLYVAATRAKSSIFFTGVLEPDAIDKLPSNSFLSILWNSINDEIQWPPAIELDTEEYTKTLYYRLPVDKLTQHLPNDDDADNPIDLDPKTWQVNHAATIGTITHRCLQQISIDGLEHWNEATIKQQHAIWMMELLQSGIHSEQANIACQIINKAIQQTLTDNKGRWILQGHTQAHSELAINTTINNRIQKLIIDRCFIDEQQQLWIVDYKVVANEDNDIAQFIEAEKVLYRSQLTQYQTALSKIYSQEARCALYFLIQQL